jgi:LacI family transcriptional regulator
LNYQPNLAARNLAGTKSFSITYVYDNPNAYYITVLDVKVFRIMSGDVAPDDLSPCVMVNDRKAAQTITQNLIGLGHKGIGIIVGGAEHMSTIERYKGYRRALKADDIVFNKNLLIEGEYSFESGVQGAKKLMSTDLPTSERPTVIFSCNDEISASALFAARLMNIAIPEQLSITGFENSPFSRQTWPKITTVDQPNKQIAKDATRLLISQIRKRQNINITSQYIPQLVVRDSTGHISI